jgi:hypothetical protein
MVEAELATRDRSGKLRITGAAKRIAYLDHQKKAGREGGLKSAELRAKDSKGKARVREASLKQTSSDGQGSGNPSVPDSVPDPDSASVTAPDAVLGDTAPASRSRKHQLTDDWLPARSEVNLRAEGEAVARGVDLQAELQRMRNWAKANAEKKADWDATWRNWTSNSKARGGARGGGGEQLDHLLRLAGEQP